MRPTGRSGTTDRLLRHGLGFDGVRELFANQPVHFAVQAAEPPTLLTSDPEAYLLGVLVPKQPLSQGPVPVLHDALVPMDVNTSTSNLNKVFCQLLADRAHELTPGVNLEKLKPLQWPSSVDPRQSIGYLCRGLASQRLSLFVALGYINDRESVAEGFSPHAVVRKKEQVSLVDLVGTATSNWPRYAPWDREVDLPDGLFLQPNPSQIFRYLGCRRQRLDSCEPLSVASGAVVYFRQAAVGHGGIPAAR